LTKFHQLKESSIELRRPANFAISPQTGPLQGACLWICRDGQAYFTGLAQCERPFSSTFVMLWPRVTMGLRCFPVRMSSSRLSKAKHQNPVSSIEFFFFFFSQPNFNIYIGLCHNQDIFQFFDFFPENSANFLNKKNSEKLV
jgi:hypothetical protein